MARFCFHASKSKCDAGLVKSILTMTLIKRGAFFILFDISCVCVTVLCVGRKSSIDLVGQLAKICHCAQKRDST